MLKPPTKRAALDILWAHSVRGSKELGFMMLVMLIGLACAPSALASVLRLRVARPPCMPHLAVRGGATMLLLHRSSAKSEGDGRTELLDIGLLRQCLPS